MQRDTPSHAGGDAPDWTRIADWLRWTLADVDLPGLRLDAPMEVHTPHGYATPNTHVVRFGGAEFELHLAARGNPDSSGPLPRGAAWQQALHPLYPLAPRLFALCTEVSVAGRMFAVTEHRRGVTVGHAEPIALHDGPERRAELSRSVVDALADLHRIDTSGGPLAAFGHDPDALDNELRQWLDVSGALRGTVPDLDAVALWLTAYEPAEPPRHRVVHGGFTFAALRLDPLDPQRLVAVVDWDRCRLGDPLADLGTLLASWVPIDETTPGSTGMVTAAPGYLTCGALAAHYADRTGVSLDSLAFHEVFALFRRAVTLATGPAAHHTAARDLARIARQRTLH